MIRRLVMFVILCLFASQTAWAQTSQEPIEFDQRMTLEQIKGLEGYSKPHRETEHSLLYITRDVPDFFVSLLLSFSPIDGKWDGSQQAIIWPGVSDSTLKSIFSSLLVNGPVEPGVKPDKTFKAFNNGAGGALWNLPASQHIAMLFLSNKEDPVGLEPIIVIFQSPPGGLTDFQPKDYRQHRINNFNQFKDSRILTNYCSKKSGTTEIKP